MNKNLKIAVAGTGYVGLSIATLLSQHHEVWAVDIIPEKVDLINRRKSPIQDEYIEKYLAEKPLNLTATLDAEKAYTGADFVVIAAPTNYDSKTQHFDTSAVEAVIKLVMQYNPDAIMVIKSTIPVGYTASVREKFGTDNILFSPEFLREEVLPIIRDFMAERGLQLSEEKTVITHIDDGFDFLGKNIRKYNGKLLIKPSKQSVGSLLKKVREIVKSNKSAKQDSLIRQLNPVIRGWVNNQRFVVSAETFSKIDYQIYNCLWQWAKRRHKNKGRRWIAAKYWHRIGTRNWTFAAEERTKKNGEQSYFALEYATDTKIIRFKKIVSNANPFDERWNGYYEERDGEKMLNSTNGREKLLKAWRNQHRCCPVCNEPITSETSFKVHKVFRSGKSPWLEMVHPECHAVLHKNDSCFVEPGSLTGAL